MFSSIRVRLTLSHLVVIIIAMGLSGFLLLSFLDRYFLQAMEDSPIRGLISEGLAAAAAKAREIG